MAAVTGLRGMARGEDFKISIHIDGDGNCDDIMYTAGDRSYLLQFKHSYIPQVQTLRKEDIKILLSKCFKSYCQIKHAKELKGETIDKLQFIIYTDRDLTECLSEHKRKKPELDIFFATCNDKVFSFTPDENKETDVYTFLENTAEESKKHMVSEFLNKLIMATGQKGNRELDDLIPEEIRNQDAIKGEEAEYKSIYHQFKTSLENWRRNPKTEDMTPEMIRNWLQRAKTDHFNHTVTSFYNSYTIKLVKTGIKFSSSAISSFKVRLSNNRAVHLRSDALTLCSILLLDCLDTSKCIFVTFESLHSNTNTLLHAWLGGHWQWLAVFCDSTVRQTDISDTCNKITEIIKLDPSNKQVVILTPHSVQTIGDFFSIDHQFKFEQLSVESKK